jgi:hypothetical protein
MSRPDFGLLRNFVGIQVAGHQHHAGLAVRHLQLADGGPHPGQRHRL